MVEQVYGIKEIGRFLYILHDRPAVAGLRETCVSLIPVFEASAASFSTGGLCTTAHSSPKHRRDSREGAWGTGFGGRPWPRVYLVAWRPSAPRPAPSLPAGHVMFQAVISDESGDRHAPDAGPATGPLAGIWVGPGLTQTRAKPPSPARGWARIRGRLGQPLTPNNA
jgi:hypothetical protein